MNQKLYFQKKQHNLNETQNHPQQLNTPESSQNTQLGVVVEKIEVLIFGNFKHQFIQDVILDKKPHLQKTYQSKQQPQKKYNEKANTSIKEQQQKKQSLKQYSNILNKLFDFLDTNNNQDEITKQNKTIHSKSHSNTNNQNNNSKNHIIESQNPNKTKDNTPKNQNQQQKNDIQNQQNQKKNNNNQEQQEQLQGLKIGDMERVAGVISTQNLWLTTNFTMVGDSFIDVYSQSFLMGPINLMIYAYDQSDEKECACVKYLFSKMASDKCQGQLKFQSQLQQIQNGYPQGFSQDGILTNCELGQFEKNGICLLVGYNSVPENQENFAEKINFKEEYQHCKYINMNQNNNQQNIGQIYKWILNTHYMIQYNGNVHDQILTQIDQAIKAYQDKTAPESITQGLYNNFQDIVLLNDKKSMDKYSFCGIF